MIIADLSQIAGRAYPARRRTQNLVGGASPIQATNFSMGNVTLEPNGGQVPWHNQEQEEIYFILEGTAKCALAKNGTILTAGQAVYIPPARLSPTDEHRRLALPHDLLLRAGRRCCALASGTGRNACRAPASKRPRCLQARSHNAQTLK